MNGATYKEKFRQLILRCQRSPTFFIENFCKVKHPKAGVIPFSLFKYQNSSLSSFLKYRFNVYKKTRQCGVSTLAGVFALWYAMFFSHKTILIVSKRDTDAIAFLAKNVKFVYDYLPSEFKSVYGDPPQTWNEHTIAFTNGSSIKSLTSHPETLRSNSASLNIIDEAAHMPHMEQMWAAGYPTLQHGGSVVVVSTTNGIGDWYHGTWEDALSKTNDFNPIEINWWDMDWKIKYKDELTGQEQTIAPTAGIRKCETKQEADKWGPFYSPWLEEQYRQLQKKGEAHLFRQEVLAEFIGTGNTVLSRETLLDVGKSLSDDYYTVDEVPYIHPVTGESLTLPFNNDLHVWRKPVRPGSDIIENGKIIQSGEPGHTYAMGVDISSGEASDFSSIQVIDVVTKEQVAELNTKVLPKILLLMVDYLGRWYNGAFCVPERTGIGIPFCQSLYLDIGYFNIFRMLMPSGKRSKKVGYPTTAVHKPAINKALMDMLGEDGVVVYSKRLQQQLYTYVHLTSKTTGAVKGEGNQDDLVIAMGLALLGIKEAVQSDSTALVPMQRVPVQGPNNQPRAEPVLPETRDELQSLVNLGGMNALVPIITNTAAQTAQTPDQIRQKFIAQLGGIPVNLNSDANPNLSPNRKYTIWHPSPNPTAKPPPKIGP